MSSSAKIAVASPSPRLPRRFGPFLLFDQIGKGGMAEIFLARAQSELGGSRLCVVKEIIPAFSAHRRFAEMLIHEAKLAALLDHANIVKVIDLGRADDELYIAMEYVEGFDLTDLLRRCTKAKVAMPFEFVLAILTSVLRGLDYAHRRTDDQGHPLGIVHRDVSPSNVLISFEGEVKLCDFGIALANQLVAEEPPESGATEALQGKAGYMSPEHARGEPFDARSDVFAAGVLLWELMSGRRMYRQDGKGTLLEQARSGDVPPLSTRGLVNEASVRAIALRALDKDKEARYPSAAAMLRDLETYMSESKIAPSALKLGSFLEENFGTDIVKERRMRQRAAEALEKGPPVVITPLVGSEPKMSNTPARPPIATDSAPTSIDAATVDLVPSRPDVHPTHAGAQVPARTRGGRALWLVLVFLLFALGLAYAFMARAP
jgi:eukaryotic-like serine/threonine-protein kinase